MVVRIPYAHDVFHAIPILSAEFRVERATELGLHVVGDAPEPVAAIDALEWRDLIEVTERPG